MEQNILLEEIIKRFDLYKKQELTYNEFLNMYNKYSEQLTEVEFANLLGIHKKTFFQFKSASKKDINRKIKILTERHLTTEEENKKILELIEKYNLNKGQKISYEFLKTMHEEVKTVLTEIEFANLLGISDSNLKNIRNTKDKARIFKNCKLDNDKTERIRKQILNQYEGKKTYYESNEKDKGEVDFLELYKPFRIYFSENEFAKLLGISEKNLWYAKHNIANPRIKDTEKIRKIEKIKSEIEKLSYLKKDEIEEVCKTLEMSVEDFITYYINNGDFFDSSVYKQALDVNNGLWIKNGKIEQKDIQEYEEIFLRISRTIATKIKKNYAERYYNEDLQENILIYILENCADLVKNFKYDIKIMERMIWLRARLYAKIIYLTEQKEKKKLIPFDERIAIKKDINNNNAISRIEINQTEDGNIDDEQLVNIFKNCLLEGYSKETILKALTSKLNFEEPEIIEKIKKYLIEQRQEKQNNDEEYEIGEE